MDLLEKSERSTADLAFSAVVFLEHLNVWIVWQALLANTRHVCRLPSTPVHVQFGSHLDDLPALSRELLV